MSINSTTFTNELGNQITMSVEIKQEDVTIIATGPTSQVENIWTHLEIAAMCRLIASSYQQAIAEEVSRTANL